VGDILVCHPLEQVTICVCHPNIKKTNTNTSTLKQCNQHAITKLKHIMQAKSRKEAEFYPMKRLDFYIK
jgi:hypothetical protein